MPERREPEEPGNRLGLGGNDSEEALLKQWACFINRALRKTPEDERRTDSRLSRLETELSYPLFCGGCFLSGYDSGGFFRVQGDSGLVSVLGKWAELY